MELRHRLVRQTINRAVSKAMEDMTENTGRGIRKLTDLGLMFAKSENQKWFFSTAQEIVSNPKNSYNKLISRVLSDIDGDTVRTVGLNLGYSSLIYGARKLQKRQKSENMPFPWLLIFDIAGSDPEIFSRMEVLIRDGQEMGIYSYIFHPSNPEEMTALCTVAKNFRECFFAFQVPARLVTEQTALSLAALSNAAVSVEIPEDGSPGKTCAQAFRHLKDNRCLYGFHSGYRENRPGVFPGSGLIRRAISCGCVFGVFFASEGVSAACRKAAYDFVTAERNGSGLPLVAFEWDLDMEDISRRIHVAAGYRLIRLGSADGGL